MKVQANLGHGCLHIGNNGFPMADTDVSVIICYLFSSITLSFFCVHPVILLSCLFFHVLFFF